MVAVIVDAATDGANEKDIDLTVVGDKDSSVDGVLELASMRGRGFSNQSCSSPEVNLRMLLPKLDS